MRIFILLAISTQGLAGLNRDCVFNHNKWLIHASFELDQHMKTRIFSGIAGCDESAVWLEAVDVEELVVEIQ